MPKILKRPSIDKKSPEPRKIRLISGKVVTTIKNLKFLKRETVKSMKPTAPRHVQ